MQKLSYSLRLFLIAICLAMIGQNIYLVNAANGQTISGAEIFFDTDPGEGNGIPLLPEDGAFDSKTEQARIDNLDTSELSVGSHEVYLRFIDSNGNWGNIIQKTLKVDDVTPIPIEIIGAEFFFDIDPGEGNGTPMVASDGNFDSGFEDMFFDNIDTSELSLGTHTVFVRGKDSDGQWTTRPFSTDFVVTGTKVPLTTTTTILEPTTTTTTIVTNTTTTTTATTTTTLPEATPVPSPTPTPGRANIEVSFDRESASLTPLRGWIFTVFVEETNGVGLTITDYNFTIFDNTGNVTLEVENDTETFVSTFNDCGDQTDAFIPALDTACGFIRVNRILASPGSTITFTFIGIDENGNSVDASGTLGLEGRGRNRRTNGSQLQTRSAEAIEDLGKLIK